MENDSYLRCGKSNVGISSPLRRLVEMEYGMSLHIVHVSGKRMIAQGTDGCSRGSLMEGVMAGENMLSFIDLGCSALDRHQRASTIDKLYPCSFCISVSYAVMSSVMISSAFALLLLSSLAVVVSSSL